MAPPVNTSALKVVYRRRPARATAYAHPTVHASVPSMQRWAIGVAPRVLRVLPRMSALHAMSCVQHLEVKSWRPSAISVTLQEEALQVFDHAAASRRSQDLAVALNARPPLKPMSFAAVMGGARPPKELTQTLQHANVMSAIMELRARWHVRLRRVNGEVLFTPNATPTPECVNA